MKETVLQFGEGGFLRGFVDYFFQKLNDKKLYDGKIVVVQPIEQGLVSVLNEQKGEYNLYLRGIDEGNIVNERTHMNVISRGINPYEEYDEFLKLAHNPDLRVIVSNTTEAGIEYLGTESIDDAPPKSYPAKLTRFLWERYQAGLKGFILLPCELIDHNADYLKEYVIKYALLWNLPDQFLQWIEKENDFCNTLVDRIVTGYPREEAEKMNKELGYEDKLLDTAEPFHLWVIQGNHEDELPFQKAGYHIVWTDDVTPYKKRKVRILNGAHTSMVLAAHLYGLETVGECMKDQLVLSVLKQAVFEEIIPTLGNTQTDIDFGNAVMDRFSNPFIRHQLLSIALNSVSKFKVRVLPTILEYKEQNGIYPKTLTFSLAALIAFYKTDAANDDGEIVEFMKTQSVDAILSRIEFWDTDLSDMFADVMNWYQIIQESGMEKTYEMLLA
jgi:tagaturonate reductase